LITPSEKAFQLDRTFQFWHFPTAAYVRLPLVVKIFNFFIDYYNSQALDN